MTTNPASGTKRPRLHEFPGTDDYTGWPLEPRQPCYKQGYPSSALKNRQGVASGVEDEALQGNVGQRPIICHMRVTDAVFVCGYEPESCPFYGRFPVLSNPFNSKKEAK